MSTIEYLCQMTKWNINVALYKTALRYYEIKDKVKDIFAKPKDPNAKPDLSGMDFSGLAEAYHKMNGVWCLVRLNQKLRGVEDEKAKLIASAQLFFYCDSASLQYMPFSFSDIPNMRMFNLMRLKSYNRHTAGDAVDMCSLSKVVRDSYSGILKSLYSHLKDSPESLIIPDFTPLFKNLPSSTLLELRQLPLAKVQAYMLEHGFLTEGEAQIQYLGTIYE